MKGKELHSMLHHLPARLWEEVIALVPSRIEDAELQGVFDVLIATAEYDENAIRDSLDLLPRKYARICEDCSKVVVAVMGQLTDETEIHHLVAAARTMVMEMDTESALALLHRAFALAEATERFEVIVELWKIVDLIVVPVELDYMGRQEALRKQMNLVGYELLREQLFEVKDPECTVDRRRQVLKEVAESPVLDESAVRSIRAKAVFLKVKASHLIYSLEYEGGRRYQERLTEWLKEHPWLEVHGNYFLIKELSLLANLHVVNDDLEAAHALIFQIGVIDLGTRRGRFLRFADFAPKRQRIAMWLGDETMGDAALETMLDHFEQNDEFTGTTFRTRNLYCSAYYCLARKNMPDLRRIYQMLRRCARSEFSLQDWAFTRMLEIFILFENEDYDQAKQAVLNFRKSPHYKGSRFFKLGTGLINRLVSNPATKHPDILESFRVKFAALQEDPQERRVFAYFDALVWINAQLHGTTMMEEFRRRRSDSGSETSVSA